MSWEAVAAVGGVIGVIVSIATLVAQNRALRRSIQSATYQNVLHSINPHWALLAEHPQIFRAFYLGGALDELNPEDQVRAELAWIYLANWHETALLQAEYYGAAPKETATQWANALIADSQLPVFRHFWARYGSNYHPLLQQRVAAAARPSVPSAAKAARRLPVRPGS